MKDTLAFQNTLKNRADDPDDDDTDTGNPDDGGKSGTGSGD
jgi:hypothetical protein|tara:strand:- start:1262 stop:1384 length:123 start_codon:yes stop_codon:yes gene_type:complete